MNLMRIKYFVEVAKWGSFSKAAQTLYVSQPNLSRQIALMEQEVGFELFQRSGKRIQLTRAGEYLYSQLREVPEPTPREGEVNGVQYHFLTREQFEENIAQDMMLE